MKRCSETRPCATNLVILKYSPRMSSGRLISADPVPAPRFPQILTDRANPRRGLVGWISGSTAWRGWLNRPAYLTLIETAKGRCLSAPDWQELDYITDII
jgi:hypothetical protein